MTNSLILTITNNKGGGHPAQTRPITVTHVETMKTQRVGPRPRRRLIGKGADVSSARDTSLLLRQIIRRGERNLKFSDIFVQGSRLTREGVPHTNSLKISGDYFF